MDVARGVHRAGRDLSRVVEQGRPPDVRPGRRLGHDRHRVRPERLVVVPALARLELHHRLGLGEQVPEQPGARQEAERGFHSRPHQEAVHLQEPALAADRENLGRQLAHGLDEVRLRLHPQRGDEPRGA